MTRSRAVSGTEVKVMSKASVAMRVCSECYGIEEERLMFRCAKCGRFLCAECNCKCAEPKKEPVGERLEAGSMLGRAVKRVRAAIARWFT